MFNKHSAMIPTIQYYRLYNKCLHKRFNDKFFNRAKILIRKMQENYFLLSILRLVLKFTTAKK